MSTFQGGDLAARTYKLRLCDCGTYSLMCCTAIHHFVLHNEHVLFESLVKSGLRKRCYGNGTGIGWSTHRRTGCRIWDATRKWSWLWSTLGLISRLSDSQTHNPHRLARAARAR